MSLKSGTLAVCVLLILVTTSATTEGTSAWQPPAQGRGGRGGAGQTIEKIRLLKPNLYMVTGGGANTLIRVTPEGLIVVDTKNPGWGQPLLDAIKKVTDKPVTTIINTHTHGDHNGSNKFFPATVEIVTQENTKANMQKMPAFQDAANAHGLPDRTFTDRMTLLSGNDAIDLYYFGPAHTSGDALVVFRNARVMHAGDMFAGKGQPLIDRPNGGSGVEYGATIGKAAAAIKNVDRVIPGHSTVMTWQDFVNFGEVNRVALAYAREAVKAGKTPEQAMTEFKLPEKLSAAGFTYAGGGRGGPAGNMGIIMEELKTAK